MNRPFNPEKLQINMQTTPIVIDSTRIWFVIDGNARVAALKAMGWTDEQIQKAVESS